MVGMWGYLNDHLVSIYRLALIAVRVYTTGVVRAGVDGERRCAWQRYHPSTLLKYTPNLLPNPQTRSHHYELRGTDK